MCAQFIYFFSPHTSLLNSCRQKKREKERKREGEQGGKRVKPIQWRHGVNMALCPLMESACGALWVVWGTLWPQQETGGWVQFQVLLLSSQSYSFFWIQNKKIKLHPHVSLQVLFLWFHVFCRSWCMKAIQQQNFCHKFRAMNENYVHILKASKRLSLLLGLYCLSSCLKTHQCK